MYSNNPMDFFALGIGIFFLYLIILGGLFSLIAFYYKTMIDVMSLVRPSNRETGIGNILLTIIPLFNLVYGFIVYPKICESIKKEYEELGIPQEGDFGRGLSITFLILCILAFIPFVNIACLIVWIIFWVKIDGYKKELEKHNSNGFSDNRPSISASTDILD